MRMVLKYGGSSLADPEKIRAAAGTVSRLVREGNEVVTVVSAQGNTTDRLWNLCRTFETVPRETDACLAAGEQISAALMAMAVTEAGIPAVSLNGWQAGLIALGRHGDGDILCLSGSRIEEELDRGNTVIVTGFQAVNGRCDLMTLGRGGSDTTAAALAGFLDADACRIYTDVDGVYDRDPALFSDARRYSRISYRDMLRLIRSGARVLHEKSVILAESQGTVLEVRSAFSGTPGTLVGPFDTV